MIKNIYLMIKTKILFSARDVAAAYEIKNFVTFFFKKKIIQ